jgi:uncharacterized repeat protein (TIGR01451 family)
MKTAIKSTFAVAATAAAIAGVAAVPSLVSAWGDNGDYDDGHRRSYTVEEIESGILGDKIVFNSINVSKPIGGDERAFVAARENTGINAGKDNKWTSVNDVKVEDGKEYIVRMYVHNNSPKGYGAVAENTRVKFNVPSASGKSVKVNGFISSSNANPSKYVDYVNFVSDTNFHLEYVYGSALLENNKVGANGGIQLSDDIIQAKDAGVLIGYDALDGKVPGCYQYANYVTIRVKAVFDYGFNVEKKVRLAGDTDKTWKETVEAKVGDKVEFQIHYQNTSSEWQEHVSIRDILPSNLRYVEGSTKLMNANHPNGDSVNEDYLVGDGLKIGSYSPKANAYIMFTAEVVDDNLACGSNTLINWAQVRVNNDNDNFIKDDARVHLTKVCEPTPDPEPTPEPEDPEPTPTPELPNTGPEMVAGGVIATGSIATAAGYYIASRRQLR